MLVLTRKNGESVQLIADEAISLKKGDVIALLSVSRARPNQVRLGISAGREVRVVRSELLEEAAQ